MCEGCQDGDYCTMAHTYEEIDYHPLVYCTQLCEMEQACQHRIICSKAHSHSELRTEVSQLY